MLNVKRTWITWAIVGGIIVLLTGFLGFQYNWLVQAGDAEREKMQKRVDADTKAFADDFNREIQAAFFNFQTDPKSWEAADWTEFNERFDFWRSKTEYPELIDNFTYFDIAHQKKALRYNVATRSFEPIEITPELEVLRIRIESDKDHKPILREGLALVMPIHASDPKVERIRIARVDRREGPGEPPKIKMPERVGHLVIQLDRQTVTSKFLPSLVSKHFQDSTYNLRVSDHDGATEYVSGSEVTAADTSADLLTLTPDNFMFFSSRELLPKDVVHERKAVISQHVESHTLSTNSNSNSSSVFTIELNNNGEKRRQSVIAGTGETDDGWKLEVQHQAGSIAAFVDGEKNKRMLIGSGVYLLVVGAILAIMLSTLRSQRLAQRQIDFVSSVSHEFRTPLAVIYSAGENLADGVTKDREQISRYGELLKGEGRKLSGMVEQILAFAGARSGHRKYNFTPTDPKDIIENAIAECRSELSENDFAVETVIDDELPMISADAAAISSAIQNLIRNSMKYSNGTKWVRVNAKNEGGTIKLVVEDKGIGIATGDIGKIFDPFYRAKDVVDAQINGNGIGLSLVKEIIEAHGGSVYAESIVGKGSKFTIELPQ